MTNLDYLCDTCLFESSAYVADVQLLPDGRTAIILDRTIFYPQGGGQPCDTGIISGSDTRFVVTDVRLDPEGIVRHMGNYEIGTLTKGQQVTLIIDQERRMRNAKIHSAGHLIDCAIVKLKLHVKPTKGYHFPEGPYVEYDGEIENSIDMIKNIQEQVDALLEADSRVDTQMLDYETAAKRGIKVPEGKQARIVQFGLFEPCGCGGTHVSSTKEIGKIIIRKIKSKGGVTRISYEVQ